MTLCLSIYSRDVTGYVAYDSKSGISGWQNNDSGFIKCALVLLCHGGIEWRYYEENLICSKMRYGFEQQVHISVALWTFDTNI